MNNPVGNYVSGHDEPSLLFYSNKAGSGNSNQYSLTLPTDPPTAPSQDGSGSTSNSILSRLLVRDGDCDDQSAPNPGVPCKPDTSQSQDEPEPELAQLLRADARHGVHGDAVLPAGWAR